MYCDRECTVSPLSRVESSQSVKSSPIDQVKSRRVESSQSSKRSITLHLYLYNTTKIFRGGGQEDLD
jgi:hypothetical protein